MSIIANKSWRHLYSDHPEDFDFSGNPLQATILARQKEKEHAEEVLRGLIGVARHFPDQLERFLTHVISRREELNGEHRR